MLTANSIIQGVMSRWLDWVAAGADHRHFKAVDGKWTNFGGEFGRDHGLCIVVCQALARLEADIVITQRMADEVSESFEKKIREISKKLSDEGVNVSAESPFCIGRLSYTRESDDKRCHLNERRIAFAKAVVAGEIVFEEPVE